MCDFASYLEYPTDKGTKILFLTDADLKIWRNSKDQPKYPDKSDNIGHSAIKLYYGITDERGAEKEVTDFSSPSNFPPEIVNAIKTGQMRYGLPDIKQLLNQHGQDLYNKKVKDQAMRSQASLFNSQRDAGTVPQADIHAQEATEEGGKRQVPAEEDGLL